MIFTSYFANERRVDPKRRRVSIARYSPSGIGMESYPPLIPSKSLLSSFKNGSVDEAGYEDVFRKENLSRLDPSKVFRDLNESVLFCYEKPEDFCHRKIIRKWLAEAGYLSLEYKNFYKIAVVGSRTYSDRDEFFGIMRKLVGNFDKSQTIEFVSGGADGADSLAGEFAESSGIPITEILPEWKKYGKRAGFIRNSEIWKEADFGIAFWDGKSRGTEHSFKIAKSQGKILVVYNFIEKRFSVFNFEPLRKKES
jgi:hypothetical protein